MISHSVFGSNSLDYSGSSSGGGLVCFNGLSPTISKGQCVALIEVPSAPIWTGHS